MNWKKTHYSILILLRKMSVYHMIFGKAPSHYLLPMLGVNEDYFPRYRDVFIEDKQDSDNISDTQRYIYVYTRAGGGNREEYEQDIERVRTHSNYLRDYDDDFDYTYMTFVFSVPEEWSNDYDMIKLGKIHFVSDKYKSHAENIYGHSLTWN